MGCWASLFLLAFPCALLEQVELWKGSAGGCHLLHPQTRVRREVEVGRKESEPPSLQLALVSYYLFVNGHLSLNVHFHSVNAHLLILCLLMKK